MCSTLLHSTTMTTPRSVRFEPEVMARLRRSAGQYEGASLSTLVNRYVDEGIRMEEHPGVFFRDGSSGRRAVLAGGPDVWEVIRAVKIARQADPTLSPADVTQAVSEASGVTLTKISIAIDYWSAYPDEIDAWIEAAEADEAAAQERMRRGRDLLAS